MKRKTILVFAFILLCSSAALFSKQVKFHIIDPVGISRYNEDRIAYQRIEKAVDPLMDNSIECLMVIKNSKVYYVVDGYDAPDEVRNKRILMDNEQLFMEENDFWSNKINGKPDYARVIYRRSDLIVNTSEEFVTNNFGAYYRSVRDNFIRLHIEKYRNLLRNRGESGLIVNRILLSAYKNPDKPGEIKQRFKITASAKAADETIYYCEDADGDGITETFMVRRGDGFDWGIESGPNIIMILRNTDKDVETLIGKAANEAVHGTVEEEKKMIQTFPSERSIIDMAEWITPVDRFYE